MKRVISMLLTAAMVTTLAVGCGSSSQGAAGSPAEASSGAATATQKTTEAKDMTIVIVPKAVHAWFDQVNIGAQNEAKLLSDQTGKKVQIDYRAPENADVTEQNSTLEQAAATHPAGIALDPVDYQGSKAVIEEIQAQGIPVVLFDAPSPEGSGLTSVGNDFTEQARLAAEKLVQLLGEKGKVAVMQGAPSAPNHAERYKAHLDTLKKYPNIEVIDGGIDNDNVETAKSQAASVLSANPDLDGYLNCDAGGSGIAAAIEEAGKSGKVKFVAMDSLIEILDYIPDTITATSSTLPQMQGEYAVLMVWQAANGMDIPAKVDTGIAYIDASNVDQWKDIVQNKGSQTEAEANKAGTAEASSTAESN